MEMFKGKDGRLSSTKLLVCLSFISFVTVTGIVLWIIPEKFNYEIFATFTAGMACGLRGLDKYLNIKNNEK